MMDELEFAKRKAELLQDLKDAETVGDEEVVAKIEAEIDALDYANKPEVVN